MAQTRSIGANLLATPTVLRGSAVVAAGAGVTPPATFDTTKLQNTLRVPIEITELLVTTHDLGGAALVNSYGGAMIELDLRVGGKHLTNGFVPFQVLAPWNASEDNVWANPFDQVVARMGQRRVVLTAPIRLRPGVGFSGAARRAPGAIVTSAAQVTTTVTITAIGRVVPEGVVGPTAQDLPLWTAATLLTTAATSAIAKTSERDFFNPLAVPLDVSRIITAASLTAATGYAAAVPGVPTFDFDPVVTLRWPNGDLLGVDPIYLQSAFIREHTIAHKFQLPPGSRVSATFNYVSVGASYLQAAIFGTRREVL